MRALLVVVIALATLWSGYWVAGSVALQKSVEGWFAGQTRFEASNSDVTVRGFPNRFDLTVTDLRLADPVSGYGWTAPFAQVFSMTWKPWHLIAALPNSQSITTPDEEIVIESSSMLGSLVLVPGTSLALDSSVLAGSDLAASSTRGWVVKAAKAQLATRQSADLANGHEINLTVTDLIPDPALMAALAGSTDLPALVAQAQIDVTAGFTAPIDRLAGQSQPQLSALNVNEGGVRWGDVALAIKGGVVADAGGFAEGRLEIRVTNWRRLLPVVVAMGMVKPEVAPTVENMMTLMAQQTGDDTVLELPLVMQGGRMSLGPLPIGPAPRLVNLPQG